MYHNKNKIDQKNIFGQNLLKCKQKKLHQNLDKRHFCRNLMSKKKVPESVYVSEHCASFGIKIQFLPLLVRGRGGDGGFACCYLENARSMLTSPVQIILRHRLIFMLAIFTGNFS